MGKLSTLPSACDLEVNDYPPLPTLTPTSTFTPEPGATSTPTLPECRDGIDNDGDGYTDYSATRLGDPQCSHPDDNKESR